ncbi:hypothetical protein JTB14_035373 [Gonioctena quinquepunctata]|nr:hypothetical protein JTB14_035373 [Gonioctena quinquepunctata]
MKIPEVVETEIEENTRHSEFEIEDSSLLNEIQSVRNSGRKNEGIPAETISYIATSRYPEEPKDEDVLQKLGFTQRQNDQCLFLKNEQGDCIYLLIYVDDFIICHKKKSVIKKLGDDLNRFFDIVDLGNLTYFLGIRIQRTDDGSFLLDQEKKINQLVQEFSLEDDAPVSIPMHTDYSKLIGNEECLPNNEKYRRAVRVLLYLSTVSRPDIAI